MDKIFKPNEAYKNTFDFVSLEIEIKKDKIDILDMSSGVYGEVYDKQDFIKALRDFADLLDRG